MRKSSKLAKLEYSSSLASILMPLHAVRTRYLAEQSVIRVQHCTANARPVVKGSRRKPKVGFHFNALRVTCDNLLFQSDQHGASDHPELDWSLPISCRNNRYQWIVITHILRAINADPKKKKTVDTMSSPYISEVHRLFGHVSEILYTSIWISSLM